MSLNNPSPKVSVLMPCYNGARYLTAAVVSILEQTFVDFELLICDDGSSDDSYSILLGFQDERIRIFRNPTNKGIVFTPNFLVAQARGKYLARMDQDDVSRPNRLALQVDYLDRHPECGLLGAAYQVLGEARVVSFPEKDTHIRVALLFGSPFAHPVIMVRRECMLPFREEFRFAEDYDLWCRISEVTEMHNLPDILLDYRLHPNQVSRVYSTRQLELTRAIVGSYLETFCMRFGFDRPVIAGLLEPDKATTDAGALLRNIGSLLDDNERPVSAELARQLLDRHSSDVQWSRDERALSLLLSLGKRLVKKVWWHR